MARKARVVADGVPHHVTQRGNHRQDVFLLSEERRFYLETLRANCAQHRVAILGYCLLTNHVHLVAIPERPDGLARALGETHGRHPQRFNRRYRRSGHLWQNRFYSCTLAVCGESAMPLVGDCHLFSRRVIPGTYEPVPGRKKAACHQGTLVSLGRGHLLTALAYVDINPLRAGLLRLPEQYKWSSAPAHAAGTESDRTIDAWAWSELAIGDHWAMVLQAATRGNYGERLRQSTSAG